MKIPSCVAWVTLFFSAISQAHAQSTCSDVLKVAYDTIDTSFSTDSYRSAKTKMCATKTSVSKTNAGLEYSGIGGQLSLSDNEAEAWCRESFTTDILEERFQQNVKNVHDSVIGAWKDCMASVGAHASISTTSDKNRVFLTISYRSTSIPDAPAVIDRIDATNLDCSGLPKEGENISGVQYFVCTRDPRLTSLAAVKYKNAVSPAPVDLPPTELTPVVPAFDLTGKFKSKGLGMVVINQNGVDLSWRYDETKFEHTFFGKYISPTVAVGVQKRVDTESHCVATMVIEVTAQGRNYYCHTSRFEPREEPQCGITDMKNWSEINCLPRN